MKKSILFVFALISLLLVSCASRGVSGNNINAVYVTNTKKVQILQPAFMNGEVDGQQYLSMTFGDQSFNLLAYVFADETSIDIQLFNDFGAGMGNLYFDGFECSVDSALFPSNLKPEYIICDLQNAWYNFDALKNNYAASKLTFTAEQTADGEVRKVMSGNKLIEKIEITSDHIRITNYLRKYEYNIVNE
ncbi:MAG: DUF3261 domain-containing protein [Treponema sp.]|nr:DUF3261 domain-containing protein [Treponema sp.]